MVSFSGSDLIDAHKVFSWLGSIIGMPFLAAGLLRRNGHADMSLIFTFAPVAFLFIYKILPRDVKTLGNVSFSVAAVLSMLTSSGLARNYNGIYNALTILVAGAVGTDGHLFRMPRVDIFHYILAIGTIFHLYAVR